MRKMDFRTRCVLVIFFALALALAGACSSDDDDDDGGNPSDDDDSASPDDDQSDDDGDDDGNDDGDDDTADDPFDNLSDLLGEGEVRAGVIVATDELIGGPRARGEIGDYKIYNARIEIIIRAPDHPGVGWTTYSGNIIDADRARPADEDGADSLASMEMAFGMLRGFMARDIQVVRHGHDGTALIRVTGKDAGIHIVDGTLPTWDYHLDIVNEYILEPDADYLTIRTTLINRLDRDREILLLDIPMWADETTVFSPRAGFELGDLDLLANLRWIGGISRIGLPVSYALATDAPDRRFYAPYIDGEILPMIDGIIHLDPEGEVTRERLFIVGKGGTEIVHSTLRRFDQTPFALLEGRLLLDEGDDPAGVRIVVSDSRPEGRNYVGVLLPDETGAFSAELSPGTYTLVAQGPGRFDSAPVETELTASRALVQIPLDPPGRFSFLVIDGDDNDTPCKITFQPGHDASPNTGVTHRIWSVTGSGVENILPGDYTVTASRGYEYEIDQRNISVVAGETALFEARIVRSVDTTGYMSGDFHIHTQFSVDSQALIRVRLRELVAVGLEMPVITDHDFISDFSAIVAELGLTELIRPVAGNEVSPYYGHFCAWPLTAPAGVSDYYGIPLVEYDESGVILRRYEHPEMWAVARADFGAQVIQINHPRSGGNGWFDTVGYDPATGVDGVRFPNRWSADFDAVEVFNSGDNDKGALRDWFSFLDQGLNTTIHGNSDSHSPSSELGNPRNLFAMPTDDPFLADPEDMVQATLAHNSLVSNGPFISFSIAGEPIGGFVTGVDGGEVELDIRVQAPLWVDMDYLRIISNHGEVIAELGVAPPDEVLRFDGTVVLDLESDAWLVVESGHTTANLAPVNRGERVFAITNPIWVDVDGNGVFDPPGLPLP